MIMNTSKLKILITCILLLFIFFIVWHKPVSSLLYVEAADSCIEKEGVDCMLSLIQDVYTSNGVEASYDVFDYFLNNSREFTEVGCHRSAHRIGDVAYYNDYLKHNDLTKMKFPDRSIACGYGYYHGFLEHLIQDNPDPVFVEDTCKYFDSRLGKRMPQIRLVCFHGAGHGFTLSQADDLSGKYWGNALAYAEPAMKKCEAIKSANTKEVDDCRQGVFNVILEWMEDGDFGLVYDGLKSFEICRDLSADHRYDCYYEMGQNTAFLSGFDISRAAEIAAAESQYGGEKILMYLAGSGMTYSHEQIKKFMGDCLTVPEHLRRVCIRGIIGGFMEHGIPSTQFTLAEDLCSQEEFGTEVQGICFDRLFTKMTRFFSENAQKELCLSSGTGFQQMCREKGLVL